MKVFLSGYGKMGRMLEELALERGWEVVGHADITCPEAYETAPGADVCLDFSGVGALQPLLGYLHRTKTALVSGTTGLTEPDLDALQELGREPTLEEIAEELNLPIEKIIEANRTAADTLSLDMPVGDEEDTTIGSFVEDDNTPGPVDATSNMLLAEALTEILGTLTEREADVLKMRFGMYDGRTHTLEEVGQIFGVTRERIRQIENKAIRKLRHPSRAKKIKDFYC